MPRKDELPTSSLGRLNRRISNAISSPASRHVRFHSVIPPEYQPYASINDRRVRPRSRYWDERYNRPRMSTLWCCGCLTASALFLLVFVSILYLSIIPSIAQEAIRTLGLTEGTVYSVEALHIKGLNDDGFTMALRGKAQRASMPLPRHFGKVLPSVFKVVGIYDGIEYASVKLNEELILHGKGDVDINWKDITVVFPAKGEAFRNLFARLTANQGMFPATGFTVTSQMNLAIFGILLPPIPVRRDLEPAPAFNLTALILESIFAPVDATADLGPDQISFAMDNRRTVALMKEFGVIALSRTNNETQNTVVDLAELKMSIDMSLDKESVFSTPQPFELNLGEISADISLAGNYLGRLSVRPIVLHEKEKTSSIHLSISVNPKNVRDLVRNLTGYLKNSLQRKRQTIAVVRVNNVRLTNGTGHFPEWCDHTIRAIDLQIPIPLPNALAFDIKEKLSNILQKMRIPEAAAGILAKFPALGLKLPALGLKLPALGLKLPALGLREKAVWLKDGLVKKLTNS